MTLTSALRTATSALAGNAKHASVLSRNIAGVGDPNYVRRSAVPTTQLYGTIKVDTQRYVDRSLYNASISSNATSTNAATVRSGIDQLAYAMDIDNFANSPASMLGDLKKAVELAAATPSNPSTTTALIENGRTLASSVNELYGNVLDARAAADKEIQNSVVKINSLLEQLEEVNTKIVQGSRNNGNVLDQIDIRDNILDSLSEEVGIKIVPRADNDVMVLTSNGLMLFESRARTVSFEPTPSYGPTSVGNELMIDGVAASGDQPWLPVTTGRLGGAFKLRDDVLVKQQNQLDEVARAIVEVFSESDQTGGGKPDLAGMFTWSGGPGVPPAGTQVPGIASSLKINELVDPQAGGNPALIRDGGINGDPDYIYNTSGGASFSDRFFALADAFGATTTFDAQAGLETSQSLSDFASASLDWLNSTRQAAINDDIYQTELSHQYDNAYQSAMGANLDDEMSKLLEVERAYQASAKIMSTIDEMYAVFFNAVRT